jgi:ribosomal protein S18 acetylase RimI-like enzyme
MNSLQENNAVINYAVDTKDAEAVCTHLMNCDEDFITDLLARMDVKKYAEKITSLATRFEALYKGRLVGLVACYLNDPDKKFGFITNVSVVGGFKGKGIAYQLMQDAISAASRLGFDKIRLEVRNINKAARALYEKCGFERMEEKKDLIIMQKRI